MILAECLFDFATRTDSSPTVRVSRRGEEIEIFLSDEEGAELKLILGVRAVSELLEALEKSLVRRPGRAPVNEGLTEAGCLPC